MKRIIGMLTNYKTITIIAIIAIVSIAGMIGGYVYSLRVQLKRAKQEIAIYIENEARLKLEITKNNERLAKDRAAMAEMIAKYEQDLREGKHTQAIIEIVDKAQENGNAGDAIQALFANTEE